MNQHVYARLAGFKLVVIPRAPFRMEMVDAAKKTIDVKHFSDEGDCSVRVTPGWLGCRWELGQGTRRLEDVASVVRGPHIKRWRVETSMFVCDWPEGYAVCSNNFPQDPAPFDFIGAHGEMIWVSLQHELPDLEEMRSPDQRIMHVDRESAAPWIDLEYDHDGVPWRQRHRIMPYADADVVVSTQAPLVHLEPALVTANQLMLSIEPVPPN